MATIKVYKKRGVHSYKEKRLVSEIEKVLLPKLESDPSIAENFKSAETIEDLRAMHAKYVAEETPIISETLNSQKEDNNDSATTNNEETKDEGTHEDFIKDGVGSDDNYEHQRQIIDPLNRSNAKIRDYVMDNDLSTSQFTEDLKTDSSKPIGEPKTFAEAYGIPDTKEDVANGISGSKGKSEGKDKPKDKEPFNPDFNDMSGGKKNKQTKRLAKYIVEIVSTLVEHGIVWWATNDINENKLAEYELTNEIDLTLLLSLEDGQQATVKQFFLLQCDTAKLNAKITDEEKQELSDALFEFLLEKGVAPTPTQNLIMVTLSVIGKRALIAFQMKAQTNSVLNQLREMNKPIEEHIEEVKPEPVKEVTKKHKPRKVKTDAVKNKPKTSETNE